MPLLDHSGLIADRWTKLADDEAPTLEASVIVPAERALNDETFVSRNGETGVALGNAADPRSLAPILSHIALIALNFPAYRDGRAYSQANVLRQEMGFTGELRATGAVLPDQAHFMARCGFDTFEIADEAKAPVFLAAFDRHRAVYQAAADRRAIVSDQRAQPVEGV
jgi:uncharacterized protein (DUF934 family)